MNEENKKNILDYYIERNYPMVDRNNKAFQTYYDTSVEMLEYSNFLLFPQKGIVKTGKENVDGRTYLCDLIIQDDDFWWGIIQKQIRLDQAKHLQNYAIFKSFIQLQDTRIKLEVPKKLREKYCDLVIRSMIWWFDAVFWMNTGFEIESLGFTEDWNKFVFNNWTLNLRDGLFEKNEYTLSQNVDIDITYPEKEVEWITLSQCLEDLQSIEKYISPDKTISSIVLWYMIGWLFRFEYQWINNECPFLWMEWYTGLWKTSLSNFLSRIAWYNWKTIPVGDTEFALEVAMNSISWGFYFIDEIQKVSNKMLNLMQASYNSWKSHKWGADWERSKIQVYKKDCSLVCFWEVLPYHDEAFLNRFIILNPTEPFCVKKAVKDLVEFEKYYELTWKNVSLEYLTTEQIKTLAIQYYRPRFMTLLKNKKAIDFASYHTLATYLIEKTVGSDVETRLKNNLSLAITWYLILRWDNVDEQKVKSIISNYFSNLLEYRKDSILSGEVVKYITENIWDFVSWVPKVKWMSTNNPMVYLKNTEDDKWLIIQIHRAIRYIGNKISFKLETKHVEQQFKQLLDVMKLKTKSSKVAKWSGNIDWTFIPLTKIQENIYLQYIRNAALWYLEPHIEELNHILQWEEKWDMYHGVQPISKVMSDEVLWKLIDEIKITCFNSSYFDTNNSGKIEQ